MSAFTYIRYFITLKVLLLTAAFETKAFLVFFLIWGVFLISIKKKISDYPNKDKKRRILTDTF